ncbi:putative regulator protein [Pyrolobus fumarii 1A]|uniref:Putative regulator protein n=1 Tax=Pyrolobus fumarii (strain DSM 11204 / 1A) TaxID=694429 RepID=G0ED12_PYRF1|nr:regulator protein [Pyrolobus fumarii]AEM38571.1 putative regulator protein [Pyrolobus fumarii 1A]
MAKKRRMAVRVVLPPDLVRAIDALARRWSVERSMVVEEAIRRLIGGEGKLFTRERLGRVPKRCDEWEEAYSP